MSKPKLFIFAIGGTGARVIKALTHLLAAGVDIQASEIIPILMDPHQNNEDLIRTITLLETYQNIYRTLGDNRTDFFKTKINTLQELTLDPKLKRAFTFHLKEVHNEKFQQYIDYSNLDENNKALAGLLFSEKNLDTEMDIGFVGSPNIGAVVLNQFRESDEFRHFASNFAQNDRIFIISSIFGGTGAAGFPLILKNIRNAKDLDNHHFLQNSCIGAITILPYFGVSPLPGSLINKATFISKSKAALGYYEKNISDIAGENGSAINALYYLGDEVTRDYENDPGANGQQNDAHFIELAAALSIVDFMSLEDERIETVNGKSLKPIFREYGVHEDLETLTFTSLGETSQKILRNPLTQYYFFAHFLENYLQKAVETNAPFAVRTVPKIDNSFLSSSFYKNQVSSFNKAFLTWLKEMAGNKRAFAPFHFGAAQYGEAVTKIKPKRGAFGLGEKKIDQFIFLDKLNKFEQGKNFPSAEQKFINVFQGGTASLLRDYFDYFKS